VSCQFTHAHAHSIFIAAWLFPPPKVSLNFYSTTDEADKSGTPSYKFPAGYKSEPRLARTKNLFAPDSRVETEHPLTSSPPLTSTGRPNSAQLQYMELGNSLTAMDWLAQMRVGQHQAGKLDPKGHMRIPARKPPPSPIDLTARLDPVEAQAYRYHDAKPPYSYAALITFAINSSSRKRMTLSDIYNWISTNFPYYRDAGTGWKVCVEGPGEGVVSVNVFVLSSCQSLPETIYGCLCRSWRSGWWPSSLMKPAYSCLVSCALVVVHSVWVEVGVK